MEPKWPSCLQGAAFEWSQRCAPDPGEGVWRGAGSVCLVGVLVT